jgi:hypothetical protein
LFFSRAFFITLSFSSARESRADDANIVASFSVDNNQQFSTMRSPDRDETIFQVPNVPDQEWSTSADLRKPVEASSKLIRCLPMFDCALFASHSKLSAMMESFG